MLRTRLAVAALATLGIAAPAGAAPVPLTFDHVVLDTPATPKQEIVSPSGDPLKMTADIDTNTGAFTVAPSDWDFPKYAFTTPTQGTIDLFLKDTANGTADYATGKVTFTADIQAEIDLGIFGTCTKDTGVITMTTDTDKPLAGQAFPTGQNGLATGPGAFGYGWSSLQPGTGAGCPLIDGLTQGDGGLWISKGVAPPSQPTPSPTPTVTPTSTPTTSPTPAPTYTVPAPKLKAKLKKPKAVKAGRRAKVKGSVTNTGDAAASGVKACLSAPKPLKPRRKCVTVGTLAAGKSKALSYRVKTKKRRKGSFTLKLRATGSGVAAASAKTKLKVKR